jgi:hypothetical protein
MGLTVATRLCLTRQHNHLQVCARDRAPFVRVHRLTMRSNRLSCKRPKGNGRASIRAPCASIGPS